MNKAAFPLGRFYLPGRGVGQQRREIESGFSCLNETASVCLFIEETPFLLSVNQDVWLVILCGPFAVSYFTVY